MSRRYISETWADALARVPALSQMDGKAADHHMLEQACTLVDTRPGLSLMQIVMMPLRPAVFIFRVEQPVLCVAQDIAPGDKAQLLEALKNAPPMPIISMPAEPTGCQCEACRPNVLGDMRMIVCAICGNKRCPHATNHRNACTGSNEPGQPGSSWEHVRPVGEGAP